MVFFIPLKKVWLCSFILKIGLELEYLLYIFSQVDLVILKYNYNMKYHNYVYIFSNDKLLSLGNIFVIKKFHKF